MNPYGYNEQWMHSQRDARWGDMPLGLSHVTMHGFGCLVSCLAYLSSRTLNQDITPGYLCDWLTHNQGFDADGNLRFDAIKRFTNGKLQKTFFPNGYQILKFALANNQSHFVVLLKNPKTGSLDLIYDPWQLAPTSPVQSRYSYHRQIGVLYFKAS